MMRKKQLESFLQQLNDFDEPSWQLEQYMTPPNFAAQFMQHIQSIESLENQVICDFGCGTGMLSAAAICGGACDVIGFELDDKAIIQCRDNLEQMHDCQIDLVQTNLKYHRFKNQVDIVLMNPPFGTKDENIDSVFLQKAFQIAKGNVYSLHKTATRQFLQKFADQHGREFKLLETFKFPLHKKFKKYHKKNIAYTECELNMMQFRVKQQARPSTTTASRAETAHGSRSIKYNPTTPKIWKDKENLYDENIQLKQSLNECRLDLQKTKLKCSSLEVPLSDFTKKELQRYEKLLDEQIKGTNTSHPLEKQGLVIKLKNKQKSLVLELCNQSKELDQLKRSSKYTHLVETEIELQNYIEETIRLRQQLDYLSQLINLQASGESIEKRYIQQEKTLQILQKDNFQLTQQMQEIETQNRFNKLKVEELQSLYNQQQNEINQAQQIIQDQKQYIKQLAQKDVQERQQIVQQPLDQLTLEHHQKIESLKLQHQSELELKQKEIRELSAEIYKQSLHLQELEGLVQLQEEQYQQNHKSNQPSFDSIEESSKSPEVKLEMRPSVIKKRLPRIQYYEVKQVSMRLKMNLFANQIPYDQIDEYFTLAGSEISIAQVKDILRRAPFSLTDKNELTLLSRYLIEDNQDDFVLYDEQRINNTMIVQSILKKAVGKYALFTKEEEKQIFEGIRKKLNSSLADTIQMIKAKKKYADPSQCDASDLDQALKFHEIQFTAREQEKFNMVIFELSGSLEMINYQKLLSFFK